MAMLISILVVLSHTTT